MLGSVFGGSVYWGCVMRVGGRATNGTGCRGNNIYKIRGIYKFVLFLFLCDGGMRDGVKRVRWVRWVGWMYGVIFARSATGIGTEQE